MGERWGIDWSLVGFELEMSITKTSHQICTPHWLLLLYESGTYLFEFTGLCVICNSLQFESQGIVLVSKNPVSTNDTYWTPPELKINQNRNRFGSRLKISLWPSLPYRVKGEALQQTQVETSETFGAFFKMWVLASYSPVFVRYSDDGWFHLMAAMDVVCEFRAWLSFDWLV